MLVKIITLGCKVNQYETNQMTKSLEENGFYVIDDNEQVADVYIINTCTVTNMADRKSRQSLKAAKKLNPDAIVVAAGCMSKITNDKKNEKELKNKNVDLSYVDLFVDNKGKENIAEKITEYAKENNIDIDKLKDTAKEYIEATNPHIYKKSDNVRSVVKVQDGCNMFCTYCIIPYARGRITSIPKEYILKQIQNIANKNIPEVILTGIHLASYGKDDDEKKDSYLEHDPNGYYLIDLIEDINKIDGIKRIRLGSLEPRLVTDHFLERLSKCEKVCHHFHLSLQSANDKVLKKMNRRYTIDEYMQIVDKLRKQYKDCIITTDLITGFPTETDEDFEITKKNLEKMKLYKIHTFPYSERSGTPAATFKQVPMEKRKERAKEIIALSDKTELEYLEKNYNKGTKVEVLIDQYQDGYYYGFTSNYIKCQIPKDVVETRYKQVQEMENNNKEQEQEQKDKNQFVLNLKKDNYNENLIENKIIGNIFEFEVEKIDVQHKNIDQIYLVCK